MKLTNCLFGDCVFKTYADVVAARVLEDLDEDMNFMTSWLFAAVNYPGQGFSINNGIAAILTLTFNVSK